jgi:hypothetical protein
MMRPRSLLFLVPPLAIALLTGCASTSSSLSSSPASAAATTAAPAASSAAPTVAASQAASTGQAQPSAPATPAGAGRTSPGQTGQSGPQVFLAEGGDVRGTTVYRPACGSGCPLSGDGTTALWNMTWTAWDSTQADGTGTEKIDDCNPNCAAGTLHAVAVRVALSRPVMVCTAGKGTWYWTQVIFAWPNGLPAVFSGDNAPGNPFEYQDITAQQATSC